MKKLIIYYSLFLFSLLSFFPSGIIDSQDGFQYLAVARNIYYTGKPTAPVYEYDTRTNIHMSVVTGKDGNIYSLTSLGYSLAYLPAVAITDMVYKIYGVSPPIHFPLENDWLMFLTASFTNSFFGAMLGVILFLYLLELGLSKRKAIFISLVGLFATNLLVYAKHSFAHMMFLTFLTLSFLLIRLYSTTKRKYLLIISGLSFGVVMITYNPTFLLAIPSLFLYYLLLSKHKWNKESLKLIFKNSLIFLIGTLPFILIYSWFENARAVDSFSNLPLTSTKYLISRVPIGVFFEGIYGQLFSPGRSIFIYSPLLLMIVFFWYKIKKKVYPELFSFFLYSLILITFYAKAFTVGSIDQGITALWHGELSWGPRYLTPLIPLGMLIVGSIYKDLSKKAKYFVFYPLIVIGIYVEILGILMPYQTKLFNLQDKFFLNGTEYHATVYSNFLPRYTPILNMSKNLVKLVQNFPKTFDHGIYNVRFYDGIDFPFNVGPERWRVIEGKGYISFDDNSKSPVKEFTFGLINHPISEASHSATVQFVLNNTPLLEQPFQLNVTQRELVKIPIRKDLIKSKNNQLMVDVEYDDQTVTVQNKQILGLQSFDINGQRQNMESIDVPYVSSLGPKIAGANYQNWGGTNQDPWKTWHIHTQMFERLPDFWWIRNLYYWDIPKRWILIPFAINISALLFFAVKLFSTIRNR